MFKPVALFSICALAFALLTGCASHRCCQSGSSAGTSSDLSTAVHAAAAKDCGCGECAAKGCHACHGKNCYYCVSKGLVTKECGCGSCSPKGCTTCGPGCDVCKFNLAPVEASKKTTP